ncbi:GSCOCG00012077001-RA-CDS [Cotesia congregata]|uniref:Similar to Syt11: Synaptotagmin-11 (Mus musculus) n=1 Tax=Cotesia congregata TaxID=51543 RepID=A0A8J2HHC9_COTCN|nr:GSCOCG00012077001-RA-CDS [Cotesia congregata]CAG5100560.1 Similar to Syt11: Synaptotagmin-11 (Mus musculus) [Cotesia congregata]
MVDGLLEDGPLIRPVESVSTNTLVGLCIAAIAAICAAAMTWWLYRRRREHTKLTMDKSLAFRPPHRKPTAVKSPGSTSHYLKKSPSPTGPAKSPPGSGGQTPSPTGSQPLQNSNNFSSQLKSLTGGNDNLVQKTSSEVTLTVENEKDKAEFESSEKAERTLINGDTNKNELGQLFFKVRYQADQNALAVTVVKCTGLPARGHQTSDPYIKLQLLPDKEDRVKTRVLRNTRDPVYDEDFTFFGVSQSQLQKISLHFIVLSFDRYSRDAMIGEVICSLSSIFGSENMENQPISLCREICPRSLKIQSQGRGELLVSLCWQPATNRLTVVVLKARNLPKMDVTGLADPYVKIYLLYNSQRIAKKKTHTKKRTLHPVFNESFVFEIPNGIDGLGNISLEFLLLDWDRVTKNEVIGRVELGGQKCEGTALIHWNEVCSSPRRQIADWHKLTE